MTLHDALAPLLRLDPALWRGLPPATEAQFQALFGAPRIARETVLGAYPASWRHYHSDAAAGGLQVWLRDAHAVMVQTEQVPDDAVRASLPDPTAVLAHEIELPDAYAHEYLYCPIGLVLTVAQAFHKDRPDRIVRCRGTRPLGSVSDFGPAYYLPLEDRVSWTDAGTDGGVAA